MTHPRILIHHLHFNLPDGKPLLRDVTLAFSNVKTGIVGRNGMGKSTLFKLILGELKPDAGTIQVAGTLAYMPQNRHLKPEETIAAFLGVDEKLSALQRIREGSVATSDYDLLDQDWEVETRMQDALALFQLQYLPLTRRVQQLSGGESSKLALAAVFATRAQFILLDEPTNHLDLSGRRQLMTAVRLWKSGLIIVSHDRTLLNEMDEIIEMTPIRMAVYGGNYDTYHAQKAIETAAQELKWHDAKKSLRQAKSSIQASREKHEKKQAYGKDLRKSGSIDKLTANSKRGRSERTQSKLLIKSERMLDEAETGWQTAKNQIEVIEEIHVDLPATQVPNGKMIVEINNLSFTFADSTRSTFADFNMTLQGPERIAVKGDNGSGKTTLVKLILGVLQPQSGTIYLGTPSISYLDQTLAFLQPELSIIDNFLGQNPDATQNEAHRALAAFLFRNQLAYQLAGSLSGGEKLRAALASVLMSKQPPQLLILDEPTNHLDIRSVQCIESALKNYQGAMLVISHDEQFLMNIGATKAIILTSK